MRTNVLRWIGLSALLALVTGGTAPALAGATTTASTKPVITSLSQANGTAAGGTIDEILGSGFTGATKVHFGTAKAFSWYLVSDSEIVAVAPPGVAGPAVDVRVGGPGSNSAKVAADKFTYVSPPAPVISSLSSSSGSSSGGTYMVIIGTGFTGLTTVAFGTVSDAATSTFGDTAVAVVVPPGAAGTTVPVTVSGPGGTSVIEPQAQYSYTAPGAPEVTGLSLSTGSPEGGSDLVVDGSGFTGETGVNFGNVAASNVELLADNAIEVSTPAGAGNSTVDVTVTGPGGTSATGTADQFSYTSLGASSVSTLSSSGATASQSVPPITITVKGYSFTLGGDWGHQVDPCPQKGGIINDTRTLSLHVAFSGPFGPLHSQLTIAFDGLTDITAVGHVDDNAIVQTYDAKIDTTATASISFLGGALTNSGAVDFHSDFHGLPVEGAPENYTAIQLKVDGGGPVAGDPSKFELDKAGAAINQLLASATVPDDMKESQKNFNDAAACLTTDWQGISGPFSSGQQVSAGLAVDEVATGTRVKMPVELAAPSGAVSPASLTTGSSFADVEITMPMGCADLQVTTTGTSDMGRLEKSDFVGAASCFPTSFTASLDDSWPGSQNASANLTFSGVLDPGCTSSSFECEYTATSVTGTVSGFSPLSPGGYADCTEPVVPLNPSSTVLNIWLSTSGEGEGQINLQAWASQTLPGECYGLIIAGGVPPSNTTFYPWSPGSTVSDWTAVQYADGQGNGLDPSEPISIYWSY